MDLIVTGEPRATLGTLACGDRTYPCALGRAGILVTKTEGDGGTPKGVWPLRELRFRADRLAHPETELPAFPINPSDGWCDAPGDAAYNRLVRLPHPASAETLWREDALYDLVVVLGYNDDPVIAGAGSAIFFHLARESAHGLAPTEGCVAVEIAPMLEILRECGPGSLMRIG